MEGGFKMKYENIKEQEYGKDREMFNSIIRNQKKIIRYLDKKKGEEFMDSVYGVF